MASTPPSSDIHLDNTYGAVLIGTFISLIQYGWTMCQCYEYSRAYPKDSRYLKGLVIAVLVLETLHCAICMHTCYYYLITNYFNPTALQSVVWSSRSLGVVTTAVVFTSQSFFLRRVYMLGRALRPLAALAATLLVGELGVSVGGVSREAALTIEMFPTHAPSWISSAGIGLALSADWLLTGALIVSLRRSRTGIRGTDSAIDLLIIYAVNTGLLTGMVDLLAFIFALAMPQNLIYVGTLIVATKLYANTMMAAYVLAEHTHRTIYSNAHPGLTLCSRLNSRQWLAQRSTGLIHMAVLRDQRTAAASHPSELQWDSTTIGGAPPSPTAISIKLLRDMGDFRLFDRPAMHIGCLVGQLCLISSD
ncbi:hypothetical protein BD413DRAFT_610524 [Trametes elegans]|nr:hypothetical protein BD413DRAFT_610524 [Trametes elegans]